MHLEIMVLGPLQLLLLAPPIIIDDHTCTVDTTAKGPYSVSVHCLFGSAPTYVSHAGLIGEQSEPF